MSKEQNNSARKYINFLLYHSPALLLTLACKLLGQAQAFLQSTVKHHVLGSVLTHQEFKQGVQFILFPVQGLHMMAVVFTNKIPFLSKCSEWLTFEKLSQISWNLDDGGDIWLTLLGCNPSCVLEEITVTVWQCAWSSKRYWRSTSNKSIFVLCFHSNSTLFLSLSGWLFFWELDL